MKKLCAIALLFVGCADTPVGTPQDVGTDIETRLDAGMDAEVRRDVGEPCAGPFDCVAEALCVGDANGQYKCMAQCDTPYNLCEAGVCLPLTPRPESICYIGGNRDAGDACDTNLDCAPGLLCVGSSQRFLCAQACDAESRCMSGESCKTLETGASMCVSNVGQPCAQSGECLDPSLTCTSELDSSYLTELGADVCTSQVCEACPPNSFCVPLDGTPAPVCFPTCETDADCRFALGFRCVDRSFCLTQSEPETCEMAVGAGRFCAPQ